MTVRRVRWGTECEDCDILALFGSDFADDFAKALDKMGWMIIRQPRHPDDLRWNMNLPSGNCPAWANNGLLFSEEPKSEIVQLPDGWFTLARRSGRSWAR